MSKYECKQCKTQFEAEKSCGCSCSAEAPKCPQCGSTDLEIVEGLSKIRDFLKNLDFSGGG